MRRVETEARVLPVNRAALADLNGQWIDRLHKRNGLKYIVLDMDSSVSPTHGDQEPSELEVDANGNSQKHSAATTTWSFTNILGCGNPDSHLVCRAAIDVSVLAR